MKKYFLFLLLCFMSYQASSQVLISLLFGDKLNSDKLEFGLDGGFNWVSLNGDIDAKFDRRFNLGFYFDLKLKEHLYLHTGVIVKSNMGAKKLPVYLTGNPEIDTVFSDGSIIRQLNYFHVPALIRYRFDNRLNVEIGPMIGLRTKAVDYFVADFRRSDDVIFENDIGDGVTRFDFGIMAGVGYKLMNKTGLNFGVRYYYGLVDVMKEPLTGRQTNSSIYTYVGIPIGAGKAAKKREEQEAAE